MTKESVYYPYISNELHLCSMENSLHYEYMKGLEQRHIEVCAICFVPFTIDDDIPF